MHSKIQQNSNYEDKFIIGKSNPNKENFDVLIYAIGCAKTLNIPNFIEIIGPNSFGFVEKRKCVEFHPNSKLRRIEKYAFFQSLIEKITLPPSLKQIDCYAFYNCYKLKLVEIPQNSHLLSIGCFFINFCWKLIYSFKYNWSSWKMVL